MITFLKNGKTACNLKKKSPGNFSWKCLNLTYTHWNCLSVVKLSRNKDTSIKRSYLRTK